MDTTMGTTKSKAGIAFLIMLLGMVMMVATFFLPYASATDDYRERLEENQDETPYEDVSLTYGDMEDVSLVEFTRVYASMTDYKATKVIGWSFVILIGAFAAFSVITLLFTFLKKPIAVVVFGVLSMGAYKLVHFEFEDRGIIPSDSYDWGVASYLAYIGGVVLLAGAIWMFIEKRKKLK